jgi:hypothetical protein
MLDDLGNPFASIFDQPVDRQRLLVRILVSLYKTKGLEEAVITAIRAIAGIEVIDIVSPPVYDKAFKLGVSILADDVNTPTIGDPANTDFGYVNPTPLFLKFSFKVEVSSVMTQEQKDVITDIIRQVKPAHVHFLGFIEPSTPPSISHWQLGYSKIGTQTILHP